ncbi:Pyrimidine nucleotide transporter, mitochondrial [Tilletia horrida]|uniref:Pyrimidine nucleotide transporter, mitochondrial n=1 Tax=Tilletia horrida TaxID=155126 RepID=A0AAN6G7L2_9BASI|nr:Pyrimidine nucleotide transporter, mitochondrial [Tilletia horrida]
MSQLSRTSSEAASAPERERARTRVVPPKGWVHFVAGGVGGMCGAIVTAPLDLAKTRLQSDMYRAAGSVSAAQPGGIATAAGATSSAGGSGVASIAFESAARPRASLFAQARALAYHFVETGQLIRQIAAEEGSRALFKGLGPTLVGVIPARSINFYAYGNGKRVLAEQLNHGVETPLIHLSAAAIAGVATATATNPIWVVKTRLQLEADSRKTKGGGAAGLGSAGSVAGANKPLNSFQLTVRIMRSEGVRGLYKGLSASYLGVAEGTIQWVLYEYLKRLNGIDGLGHDGAGGTAAGRHEPGPVARWFGTVGAAGTAKLVASLITYPHEVLRTRMRQSPPPGQAPRYVGLLPTFRIVLQEEGAAALYGGLSAHLLRVVPNAIVMFSIYELTLRLTARKVIVPEERVTTSTSSEVISPAG